MTAPPGGGPVTRLRGARVLLPGGSFTDADVLIRGTEIVGIEDRGAEGGRAENPGAEGGRDVPQRASGPGAKPAPGEVVHDYSGHTVAPGFIDCHVHGAAGHSFMSGVPGSLDAIGRHLARHGVTSCLATTVSTSEAALHAAVTALGRAGERLGDSGVALAGVHLEGPFINPAAGGVHRRGHLREPGVPELRRLVDAAAGRLRVVTLAPELPGGMDAVRLLSGLGTTVSVGHSAADHTEAAAAFDAGARRVTHCFNALPPIRSRDPGAVPAALLDPRVEVEIIADGRHVDGLMLALTHRLVGDGRMTVVSDGSDVAGLPSGTQRRWEGTEVVVDGPSITTPDGGLAGGGHALDHGVRTMVAAGIPLASALAAVSTTPARRLGLHRRGAIALGADADLVVLDADLHVRATYAAGRRLHLTD